MYQSFFSSKVRAVKEGIEQLRSMGEDFFQHYSESCEEEDNAAVAGEEEEEEEEELGPFLTLTPTAFLSRLEMSEDLGEMRRCGT